MEPKCQIRHIWRLCLAVARAIQQVLADAAADAVGDRRREEDGVLGGGADCCAPPDCLQVRE